MVDSRVLAPDVGEPVLEVPQAYSELLRTLDGQPCAAAVPLLRPGYGAPSWHPFDPRVHPQWGTGLMVVRDGVLRPGPAAWDTSD